VPSDLKNCTERCANTSPVSARARARAREAAGNQRPWPADKVERWAIDRLIPYAKNARTHTDAQVAAMAASIKEWGWTTPAMVGEDGGLIAGHARVLAARQLGLAEIPVMVAAGWSEPQKRAYVLADNQLAITGSGWDPELLRLELGDLKELGFDLTLTGFDDIELGSLLADKTEGLTDPDDSPAVPEHPVSQTGDLWLLGRHRLLCGDSTVATDVERVLGGVEPHLMVTDPPYGVDYDPDWRNQAGRSINGAVIKPIGARAVGKVVNDDRADWREAWALYPGEVVYVWHGALHVATVQQSLEACGFGMRAQPLEACGFGMRAQLIWAKSVHVISRGHYHFQHEPCWYAVRKTKTGHWQGDRTQTSLWQIAHRKSETGHSTQKPVECMRRPIENNSSPGQAVYEPFSGSGTTIIAAAMTGRACHAIELSPAYVDVGVKRWQDFTGEAAVLDGDGRTFDQIAAERQLQAASAEATDAA
jgi:DNA modification methylase